MTNINLLRFIILFIVLFLDISEGSEVALVNNKDSKVESVKKSDISKMSEQKKSEKTLVMVYSSGEDREKVEKFLKSVDSESNLSKLRAKSINAKRKQKKSPIVFVKTHKELQEVLKKDKNALGIVPKTTLSQLKSVKTVKCDVKK